jgi:hypothetical protein
MNDRFINEQLENLKSGILSEYYVSKEDFLAFRKVLVNRQDFKHFRGIAGRGGSVVYQYLENPRS